MQTDEEFFATRRKWSDERHRTFLKLWEETLRSKFLGWFDEPVPEEEIIHAMHIAWLAFLAAKPFENLERREPYAD